MRSFTCRERSIVSDSSRQTRTLLGQRLLRIARRDGAAGRGAKESLQAAQQLGNLQPAHLKEGDLKCPPQDTKAGRNLGSLGLGISFSNCKHSRPPVCSVRVSEVQFRPLPSEGVGASHRCIGGSWGGSVFGDTAIFLFTSTGSQRYGDLSLLKWYTCPEETALTGMDPLNRSDPNAPGSGFRVPTDRSSGPRRSGRSSRTCCEETKAPTSSSRRPVPPPWGCGAGRVNGRPNGERADHAVEPD